MPMHDQFATLFASSPVMAILRGFGPARTVELAQRAWENGVDNVEVPIQTSEDLRSMAAVRDAADAAGRVVGAGTIITPELARTAADYGARYTVCPGFDLDVAEASHGLGMPCLVGVATATEVQLAARSGLTWMKAFPATVLGPGWLKAMHGPFPQINLVATGGIDASNAAEYLDAGARVVAVGSALADDSQLEKLRGLAGVR